MAHFVPPFHKTNNPFTHKLPPQHNSNTTPAIHNSPECNIVASSWYDYHDYGTPFLTLFTLSHSPQASLTLTDFPSPDGSNFHEKCSSANGISAHSIT